MALQECRENHDAQRQRRSQQTMRLLYRRKRGNQGEEKVASHRGFEPLLPP